MKMNSKVDTLVSLISLFVALFDCMMYLIEYTADKRLATYFLIMGGVILVVNRIKRTIMKRYYKKYLNWILNFADKANKDKEDKNNE